MDDRTLDRKLYDIALHSERRTIGHRMSRKVLLIWPDASHREVDDWARTNGIVPSDVIHVGRHGTWDRVRGVRGIEHVILGWAKFSEADRVEIKRMLELIDSPPFEGEPNIDSPPFEGEPNDELYGTDPVRD